MDKAVIMEVGKDYVPHSLLTFLLTQFWHHQTKPPPWIAPPLAYRPQNRVK